MSISCNVSTLRLMRGLSQEELAEKVGVHQTFISHIERGIKIPEVSKLVSIADALDCSVDWLLGRDEKYINRDEKYISRKEN